MNNKNKKHQRDYNFYCGSYQGLSYNGESASTIAGITDSSKRSQDMDSLADFANKYIVKGGLRGGRKASDGDDKDSDTGKKRMTF